MSHASQLSRGWALEESMLDVFQESHQVVTTETQIVLWRLQWQRDEAITLW